MSCKDAHIVELVSPLFFVASGETNIGFILGHGVGSGVFSGGISYHKG